MKGPLTVLESTTETNTKTKHDSATRLDLHLESHHSLDVFHLLFMLRIASVYTSFPFYTRSPPPPPSFAMLQCHARPCDERTAPRSLRLLIAIRMYATIVIRHFDSAERAQPPPDLTYRESATEVEDPASPTEVDAEAEDDERALPISITLRNAEWKAARLIS